MQPQLAALKREHGTDRMAYFRAVRELQHQKGVGAASGVLPELLQLPVLVGLYHLLVSFTVFGATGSNGLFGPEQVHSFAHATVFGVPLSAAIRTSAETLAALQPGLTSTSVVGVVFPLLLLVAAAIFVNAWRAKQRQPVAITAEDSPLADSTRHVSTIMVWLAPLGLLVAGIAFPLPLAMALYWAVNGTWTTVQTLVMTARLDRSLPLPPPD